MAAVAGARRRPWWGMGDVLMMIPLMVVVFGVIVVAVAVLAALEGVSFGEMIDDDAPLPGSMIVVPTLIQQASWFGWPFVVSRWKGLGPAADWGWSFEPADLGIGLGTAFIALFSAGMVGYLTEALVGLEDGAAAENTALLNDVEGSWWLWGVLFIAVIGAPFSEELLFRGLILRSVAKRWGTILGVTVSLLAFVPIHVADGGLMDDGGLVSDGQIVLWATIATLGLVLAVTAVATGRLAASIVAHSVINATASAEALGLWEDLALVGSPYGMGR